VGQRERVEHLERSARSGQDWTVVVWSDTDLVEIDGEYLTVAELRARFPDVRVINWPQNDDLTD